MKKHLFYTIWVPTPHWHHKSKYKWISQENYLQWIKFISNVILYLAQFYMQLESQYFPGWFYINLLDLKTFVNQKENFWKNEKICIKNNDLFSEDKYKGDSWF